MNFTNLPGLTEIKSKLIEAVKGNHIAHAQLFAGKPGSLNLPLALAYANYLHCQNKGDKDSCGTCAACSKSAKYIHPDSSFVFPLGNVKGDKDEDRFKADILKNWRSFLLEQPYGDLNDWISFYGGEDKQALISREESREIIKTLSLKPFESPFKVMIIWQPELMHPSAANGILKILEEPPANTFFILVTNAIERLLPTILSRTQIVQVPLLSDEDIQLHLQQKGLSESRLTEILSLADGSLNTAIKLIDSEQDQYQEKFSGWMRTCFKRDYGKMVAMTEEFHELDKLDQRNFLAYSLGMIRETALQFSGASAISRVKGSEVKFVQDFSKVVTVTKAEKINELISDAAYHLERNGSPKMIFLDLSLQLGQVLNP
ncbi:MAG: DNA polymerase III subunit delta [Bacteroidetes bacterium]|nr:DNA polymerase III subunit delta [Bacteroidota bacterium]